MARTSTTTFELSLTFDNSLARGAVSGMGSTIGNRVSRHLAPAIRSVTRSRLSRASAGVKPTYPGQTRKPRRTGTFSRPYP